MDCLASLERQTWRDFDVVIVDNSGQHLVKQSEAGRLGPAVLEPSRNLGFGGAINLGLRNTSAPFIAVLNDDAIAHPDWLCGLLKAIEQRDDVGACASQVRLMGQARLDSAGLLIAADGSSKQRGHGEPVERFARGDEILCPSGAAALYRRAMLDEIGLFDDDFFLYCEDTDLGLRAQWAGWKCLYVPEAVVEHEYSQSAGNASPLKAYCVERNRLMVAAKNFPFLVLLGVVPHSLARYFWHLMSALRGRGSAARFRQGGGGVLEMLYIVVRAHLAMLWRAPRLWTKRRAIRARARIGAAEFQRILRTYAISEREVAAQ